MTASYNETYRVFSNNVSSGWVVDGKLNIDENIKKYSEQAKKYVENEYTLPDGVWGAEKNAQMYKEGKIRAIGLSNFHQLHIDALNEFAEIKPMVNQIEFHPGFTQMEVV
ncbi:MAG: aldo/keto reductase, partial [Ruminiclostridium sp.]|nr:aldo/keto reductase [Ruminiclostridium sp.]